MTEAHYLFDFAENSTKPAESGGQQTMTLRKSVRLHRLSRPPEPEKPTAVKTDPADKQEGETEAKQESQKGADMVEGDEVKGDMVRSESTERRKHEKAVKEEEEEDVEDEDEEDDSESDDPERLWCICQQPHDDR